MSSHGDARGQFHALTRDTAEVVPREEFAEKLERSAAEGRPLRVKLGIDPSRPDLTLGHSVVLRKLRQFQDFGHTAVLIIGDFTGRVGDPTGESETRPFLTAEQIEANARTYLDQADLILDVERAEIHANSEWLGRLTMPDVLRLTSAYTVARMLEREDFRARSEQGRSISVVEFLYPLMQAYDSVAIRADVEMGGSDQLFNLLVGREIQREYGQAPQVVFTMPLIPGTDGVRKMSKSLGNYVALTDPPEEMFGKLMSIPDELTELYTRVCTDLQFDPGQHPNAAKRRMAGAVVELYHGPEAAAEAEARFDLVHREGEIPGDVPEVELPPPLAGEDRVWLPRLLAELDLVGSNSEGRRQIEQGAVRIDGRRIDDPGHEVEVASLRGRVVQVGRRRFLRIR